LAVNLAATAVRRVHIRVREILAHGVQGRVKAARCNALSGRLGDICCRNRAGDRPFSGRRARRLIPASAQEYHDATSDLAGREVQVGHTKREDRLEKVNEKVIVPCWIVISKSPVPAVLIGGTSSDPVSVAEKSSVCE
jgi:hypothetical protein